MRILGIDYGARRLGLAVSDPDATIATPIGTLERRGLERDLEALRALADEREVGRIVLGLPLHMSGRPGAEAQAVRAFAGRLAVATHIPVDLYDERWTTLEADRALRESGRRGARRREVVDSVAATLLLQSYLEWRRSGAARAGEPVA